jgi:hypothetical protein
LGGNGTATVVDASVTFNSEYSYFEVACGESYVTIYAGMEFRPADFIL